ncbi:MAG: YraN family protein [Actinomycetota bacterium]
MTLARQRLGRRAEEIAARRLRRQGWRIVDRNARTRFGEIDLIGIEGASLVFVEVKAGRADASSGPGRPVLAVGPAKQRRIRTLARAWLASRAAIPPHREIRFDVVGVTIDRGGTVSDFEHIRNAF